MPSRYLDLDPRLVALAERQGGVFTSRQAGELGATSAQIQWLRRHKVLVSVRRGVYALKALYDGLGDADRHRLELTALGMVLVEPAVVSHVSAGVLHGLEMLDPDLALLHVTRSDLAGSREEAGVHHHAAALPASHVCDLAGRQVTAPARTAVDIAREVARLEQAVAVIDSVLRAGVPAEELREVMEFSRSWAGARLASTAVAMGDGRAANPGESYSRVVLACQGIPPDELQWRVDDDNGLIGFADFVWKRYRVLGEFDGRGKYRVLPGTDPEEAGRIVWREKLREDRFRDRGYEVVRWTYVDLYNPPRLAARVRAACARGAQRQRPAR